MPLSRMENTTFAMLNIIDSHDMGLRTVLQSRCPKKSTYSTPIQWSLSLSLCFGPVHVAAACLFVRFALKSSQVCLVNVKMYRSFVLTF
ncbi:hypothetical protein TNCV_2981891 [Trichonephila clavipes]|nr:hypothetical protein TNCV_2981891 [Trichonephila clavipes]